jgi:hypothetical protein
MHFPNRAARPRKRQTKELKKAKETIAELRKLNLELSRKLKTEQRKKQRVLKQLQTAPDTPRRETENFLHRDDNSRMQTGMADCTKTSNGDVIHTKVLTDYLFNLFQKFQSEN